MVVTLDDEYHPIFMYFMRQPSPAHHSALQCMSNFRMELMSCYSSLPEVITLFLSGSKEKILYFCVVQLEFSNFF